MSDPFHKASSVGPLRLVPPETPDELAGRLERERRRVEVQREDRLRHSLHPFRVGSVPYLNAVPLTRGIEDQVLFAPPSQLAELLRRDELDAALISVTEVLSTDRYEILDGIAVASLGEVKSVFLAHRGPLEDAREICCDPASITSVSLLQVLLAERGLHPRFTRWSDFQPAAPPDYFLLIGDAALDYQWAPHTHEIWDLGAAWYELTRLPFVYAVWALRRGLDHAALRRQLQEARDFGLETMDHIIASRTDYSTEFCRDYLTWHIHFHLGSDERRALARFMDLLQRHQICPVFAPRFVS